MIWSWRVRLVAVLGSIALLLIIASTLRELSATLQSTLERSRVEGRLVAESLIRDLSYLAAEQPGTPLTELARHPRISKAIVDAQVAAPSVLNVVIYDSRGEIIVHQLEDLVGQIVEPEPTLPTNPNLIEGLGLIWSLWRTQTDYSTEWPLVDADGNALLGFEIINGQAFLRHETQKAFRGGVVSLTILLLIWLLTGALAARSVSRQLEKLEASIAAMREDVDHEAIPEAGWDEFGRVVRQLNLLGERFREKARRSGRKGGDAESILGDGIAMLDAEGRVIFHNHEADERLGATLETGSPLLEQLENDHVLRTLIDQVIDGEQRSVSAPIGGAEFGFVVIAHRIEDSGGPAGFLVEVKDREEHEELRGLVQHSRVLHRLGEMAAGVAHELRGPLQGLEFDLDALESSLDRPEEARAMVSELQQKIQRLEWVVSGFLKVARVRPVRTEAIPVEPFVRGACASLETEALMHGISFRIEPPEPDLAILGDQDTLARALENVLSNAVEAQPSEGGKVEVTCRRAGSRVEIAVSDTGPGIPEDRRNEIFDLYFTTKPHGTGVGLALVRQAVDLHSGDVHLESRPGRGTTVTLSLPATVLD